MSRVFADAFFYIALLNRRDAAHQRTVRVLANRDMEMVTTRAVLLEVADALTTPVSRGDCGAFLEDLEGQRGTSVHPLTDSLWRRGLELYRRRSDKEWSLTDCISFVVMKDESLTDALTGDHHFEQAGFNALLAEA